MKNLFCVLIFISLVVVSCSKINPKGEVEIKNIEIGEFKKINLNGKFKVFYTQSSENLVSVETYPNIFDNLKIELKGETLNISEKKEVQGADLYNINLYSKNNLESISVSDSVDFTASSQISVPIFVLKASDFSKFMATVLANEAKINMKDKSKANLSGRTIDANIHISDTASIISPYWQISNLNIHSKNENYSELSVEKNLSGKIENTSKLIYYGEPNKKIRINDKAEVQQK